MGPLLFTLVLLAQVTVFAAVKDQACRSKSQIQNEMNAISSNIANVSTTRTPEGAAKYVTKYLPDHPDGSRKESRI